MLSGTREIEDADGPEYVSSSLLMQNYLATVEQPPATA